MSLIAGLDFSSFALDIVLLDEDHDLARHYHRSITLPKADALTRIRRIPAVMPPRSWWADNTIAVGIEKPMSRNGRGADTMQLALGAILASLPPEHPVLLIRSDDWRRTLELPIRADRDTHKRNAKTFAAGHWADRPAVFDDNAADALCISWATRQILQARDDARRAA